MPEPRCGDGILNGYESCDPNDPNRSGWGNMGCDAFCEPINSNPNPSCNSLSVSPVSGTAPLVSSMNCSTTDATTVSINCGNGTTINGSTGICTYTNTT